jgi:diacylglycerol kinase (ATP)
MSYSLAELIFNLIFQAALHMGGHGERITQCSHVKLITKKSIPMQVDGEPCRLRPSVIQFKLRNQANLIQKPKRRNSQLQW